MDWFLYDIDLRHERVKTILRSSLKRTSRNRTQLDKNNLLSGGFYLIEL